MAKRCHERSRFHTVPPATANAAAVDRENFPTKSGNSAIAMIGTMA
jgi:hypothetical protein